MALGSSKFWVGVVVGVTASSLMPRTAESLGRGLRPIFKALIKATIKGSERTRDLASFLREVVEDAAAEAQAELRAQGDGGPAPARPPATVPGSGKPGVGSA
jgi:hypothetical protein